MTNAQSPSPGGGDAVQAGSAGVTSATAEHAPVPPPRIRRRWRRLLIVLLLLAIVGLFGLELIARLVFQLGDPPLVKLDPKLGYLMAPSRTYQRLGNSISYNAASMRASPELAMPKPAGQLRVLVMGDSVINGGPFTSDADLATTLLAKSLASTRGGAVAVGNVSAGGWCPGHLLAYSNAFGLFDADAVIIVLNHGDAFDVLDTAAPPPGDAPTATPIFAVQELFFRYLPQLIRFRVLGAGSGGAGVAGGGLPEPDPTTLDQNWERSSSALRDLVAQCRSRNIAVAVVLFPAKTELIAERKPGSDRLLAFVRDLGLPTIDGRGPMTEAAAAGRVLYRDDIHPTNDGQTVLADLLAQAFAGALPNR